MEREFKQKGLATFKSLSVSQKQVVTLKFALKYDELLTSVNLLQGLNTDITIHAKPPVGKVVNLGLFRIGSINFDRDGNAVIPFTSMVENVNMNNICDIIQEETIILRFMAVLELPDNSEETAEKEGGSEWED